MKDPPPETKRLWTARLASALEWLGPYLGLLLIVALFTFLLWWKGEPVDRFLSVDNFRYIAVHAAIPATVALGMTLLMISGGIDLSVGFVVSLVTVVTMLTYNWAVRHDGWSDHASLVAVLAGIGTGAACGLANGMLITQLKVAPFVVTLGMMGVARGIAQSLSGGSRIGFAGRSPAWVQWAGAIEPEPEWLVIGPAAWNVILLAVVVGVVLRYTVLGRHCYAIGSNEATARLCGIRVERTKVILYTLAGLLTGLAGVVQVARNNGGSHDAQAGLELEVIAAVVIGGGSLTGGEGSVMGSIIGALIMNVLENGCSKLHLPQDFRYVLIGGIIIGVAALNSWRQRRLR